MKSREVGSLVCEKYYPKHESSVQEEQIGGSGFDFNREMRGIRRVVDGYLAQGPIEQAEEFMKEKRQYLATN